MEIRTLLSGIALGAVGALMLDPDRGTRRRALLRDGTVRASRVGGEMLDTTMHDIANRTHGLAAEARGWMREGPIDDRRLLERVRSRLRRVCSHPHAVDVIVEDGQVTLRGPAFAAEVQDMMVAAGRVRGVHAVINELEAYDSADGIPALQGGGRRGDSRFDLLQPNWAPAMRALVGAAVLTAGGLAWTYARR